jgi:hypothetical protein
MSVAKWPTQLRNAWSWTGAGIDRGQRLVGGNGLIKLIVV